MTAERDLAVVTPARNVAAGTPSSVRPGPATRRGRPDLEETDGPAAEPYTMFCDLDVGKESHHATALTRSGGKVHDGPLPNDEPEDVDTYDFPSLADGKAIPYGVYDIADNSAWVSVGMTTTPPCSRSPPSPHGGTRWGRRNTPRRGDRSSPPMVAAPMATDSGYGSMNSPGLPLPPAWRSPSAATRLEPVNGTR